MEHFVGAAPAGSTELPPELDWFQGCRDVRQLLHRERHGEKREQHQGAHGF